MAIQQAIHRFPIPSRRVARLLFSAFWMIAGLAFAANAQAANTYTTYVDPTIGTGGKGNTFPGATVPYGMVQLSPDNGRNGWDWIAGYYYQDDVISGFSHKHLSGTGAGDLYDLSFMPLVHPFKKAVLDDIKLTPTIHSTFSHANETARPGYYRVLLDTYQIEVELTAAARSGHQRYTYAPDTKTGIVRLDLGYSRNWDATIETFVRIVDTHTIEGYRKSSGWAADQRVYFHTTFSQEIQSTQISRDGAPISDEFAYGDDLIVEMAFDTESQKQLVVSTGVSAVSIENARENLAADRPSDGFDAIAQKASKLWEQELARVHIEAAPAVKTQFYTALYHSALAPRLFSDANGQYKGPDGRIHRTDDYPVYDFFSLWDTFRAQHPLKTITHTHLVPGFAASLMRHYDEYGLLPVWSFEGNETNMMLGYHAIPVLYDAWRKGLADIDGAHLLTAFRKSAEQDSYGLKSYRALGYVPIEDGKWNASLTLEYAFDDWSIAELAKDLGDREVYEAYAERARNWRRQWDAESGLMRGRYRNGAFREDFDPLAYRPEDFAEANALQYTLFVPHDVEGLIEEMGGPAAFEEKVDALFEIEQAEGELPEWISGYIGQYVHGNEPSHHVPYLYQYIGRPEKTEARVRQIMRELYSPTPDGIVGNEDAGQMSAWYVFSALGFYPVNPSSLEYVFGSPLVERAKLRLPGRKTLQIVAHNQSAQNIFVEKILYNGQEVVTPSIKHQQLMSGGKLEFYMTDDAGAGER